MGWRDAERLTVTALPAITTYGEPEGTCLQGRGSLVSVTENSGRLAGDDSADIADSGCAGSGTGVTLWSVSEQVAQSRTQAEKRS